MPPTHQLNESDLIARAKAGDYEAFEMLVDAHAQPMYALAMRIVRQPHDAEDVVQTAFLNALKHLKSFREEASFGTWIRRITTNTALKLLRKRRGLPMAPTGGDANEDDSIPLPERIADWRADVNQQVQRREFRQLLEQAIDSLDEKYRLVFILRDLEELSIRETAEELGLTESNVKIRLMRARMQLRERLTEFFAEGPDLPPHQHDEEIDHSHDEGATP